ncbi:MAG: molecular chaperone HtpG, partial [Paramuribaculum sp.]|nr:molecular chaperone HtpG [Paramuribaculum sp.]
RIEPLDKNISEKNAEIKSIRDAAKDAKLTDEQQGKVTELEQAVEHDRKEEQEIIEVYAKSNPLVKQTIDLALLANGLLKGQDLNDFIRRSVSLL